MADSYVVPRVAFGDVVIDRPARRVVRAGEPQHLEPQAFDLLAALLDEPDRVIPKSELLDRVWGDQFVSESALTTRIKQIRQAVGDDGRRQAVIRNVRARGYQFVAEIGPFDLHGTDQPTTPLGELIGRGAEIARTDELLARSRLVTVVGPGGVGKTTLAKHLAARAGARRRHGWFMASLATLSDGSTVDAAVRRAAGLDGATADDPVAALAQFDAVLVLDSCEHVIDAVADLVARIASSPGSLSILATARERLGLTYEQVVPLDVLDRSSAIELFVARATAADPAFEVDESARVRIGELVDAVDRLPLAIEMAAARVRAIRLDELVPMIADELDSLRSVDRSADERHRTVAALVDWSERLLDAKARRVLTEFSVFRGAVSRADIVGVIDGDAAETMRVVADLVDRSLLVADTTSAPTRYRMLAVVRARIGRRRDTAVDERHARWFLQVAERADAQLRSDAEIEASRRLDVAGDELRAAHAWLRRHDPPAAARLTGALAQYAYTRRWTEPAAWAAELLPLLGLESAAAAGVRAALAGEASHHGEFDRVGELAASAIDAGDVRARISALETLADTALYRGDFQGVRRIALDLIQLGSEIGDLHATSLGETTRVLCEVYDGEPGAGGWAAALDADRPGLAPSDRGWIEYVRGEAVADADPESATAHYEAALQLAEATGHRFLHGVSSVSLLALRARSGDPAEALRAFPPIIDEYRRTGDETHLVTALRNLVVLFVRVGDHRAATELLASLERFDVRLPTFGGEVERLDAARSTIIDRVDRSERERWSTTGADRDLREAVDAAVDRIVDRR